MRTFVMTEVSLASQGIHQLAEMVPDNSLLVCVLHAQYSIDFLSR